MFSAVREQKRCQSLGRTTNICRLSKVLHRSSCQLLIINISCVLRLYRRNHRSQKGRRTLVLCDARVATARQNSPRRHTSSYFGSCISFVKCSACTRTVSRFVSANRMASLISSGSVSPIAALNSVRVFRMTKFCRFGVGIFIAPLMSFLYKERALDRDAGVAIVSDSLVLISVIRRWMMVGRIDG